jgi:HNH endonuclease
MLQILSTTPTLEDLCERYDVRRDGDCLVWTRAISNGQYGNLMFSGQMWQAHRLFYCLLVGPIVDGFHLHHTCAVKLCVNPSHLHLVTPQQHAEIDRSYGTKHRTHCPKGHAYLPENTRYARAPGSNGKLYLKRFCRECHRIDGRSQKAHRRELYAMKVATARYPAST